MSFSFDLSLGSDRDWVRFHIGDTNSDGCYLHDETINALVASEGSIGGASIACIKFILTQLSQPDFKLDWMSVSNKEAKDGFTALLAIKEAEFGIYDLTATSTIKHAYRADSDQYSSVTRTETVDDNTSIYDGSE